MERAYPWLRRQPWLGDWALVILLLGGSANAYTGNAAVLPVTLALTGTMVVRRRFPVGTYAVALAIGAAQVVFGIGSTFTNSPLQPTFADAGILVLLYTVAGTRRRQVSLPGLAACVLLFFAAFARWNPGPAHGHHPAQAVLVITLFYLLVPVSAWVLGDSMGYRRAYFAALEERAARAERERDAQAQIAATAERARIARELHDVIAHNLSVMVAQADGGRYAFDAEPERSRQALAEIGSTGRQALSEMSDLLGVLRTSEESPALAPAPGVAEIARLVAQAREAGMHVGYQVQGGSEVQGGHEVQGGYEVQGATPPVPAGLSLAVYRVVQEALTNVRKHAGAAAAAEVALCYGPDELLVRVSDDGVASDSVASDSVASDPGHGLAGMRERAAMYGGTVAAGPRPGGGFEVRARLPLPAVPSTGSSATGPSATGGAAA